MSQNKGVLILNRIHIHFRTHVNFKLNILTADNLPAYTLDLNQLNIDLVNPAAHLRGKVHFNINSLSFGFNRELYPTKSKKKLGIFNSSWKFLKSNKSIMEQKEPRMFEIRDVGLSLEFSLDQNRAGDNVYFLYADIRIGPLVYNYHPIVSRDLLKTLIAMNWAFSRNFKFKLAKEVDNQIKDLHHGRFFAQKKKVGMAFKNKAFKKKVANINEDFARKTYTKFSEKKFKHLYDSQRNLSFKTETHKIKHSNVVIDFSHSAKKDKKKMKELKKKTKEVELDKEAKAELEKESNQRMLENLTKMFQTIVLSLNVKTKPISVNVFDVDNQESLSVKYDDEEIKVDVDLAFKEITTVKAFGLEIQSRKSLFALRGLVERIMLSLNEVKEYQKMYG